MYSKTLTGKNPKGTVTVITSNSRLQLVSVFIFSPLVRGKQLAESRENQALKAVSHEYH
jgi:hypothetical protein